MKRVGMLVLLALVLSLAPAAALVPSTWTGDGNNLDFNVLQVGDIIACTDCAGWITAIIPGHYTHVSMYIGNGQMIEAWKEGVRVVPIDMVHNASEVAVVRVYTTPAIKQAAVNWALTKVGYPYDYQWLTYIGGKEVYGDSYYCSELVWASYLAVGGPDLDANPGWSWTYGYNVAPQEIVDDGDTYTVAVAY